MTRGKDRGRGSKGTVWHLLATSLAPMPNAKPYASTVALPKIQESFADIYVVAFPSLQRLRRMLSRPGSGASY